ncbi:MAG: O-antigen ligase family protein [Burkholderiales bacterium]|nr:O-antigen ligase family protein [Burkholderiales bacterium]
MTETGERRRRTGPRPFLTPTAYILFVLLTLMVVAPIITAGGPMTGNGNVFRQVTYAILFAATLWAVGILQQWRKLLIVPLSLMLAIGWCWLSVTWAIDPMISFRRLLLTTMIIWTIFLVIDDCGYDRTIKVLMIFLTALLVANYVAIAVSPSAVHSLADSMDAGLVGDWRGLLPQKNFTGAICALTILIFTFGGQRMWLALRIAIIVATAYYLFRTQSKTSMGMLVTALVSGAVALRFKPKYRIALIPVLLIGSIFAMLSSMKWWDEMLGPFQRQDALTGRVQIWPHLFNYAQDHPLTGSGYGSFWNIGENSPVYQYTKNWVSELGNGHNGYIDLLVQIGVPGLVLAVVATIIAPAVRLLSTSVAGRSQLALLIAMLVFCAGHNMTESSLLERDTIIEVFLMFTIALTGVITRRSSKPARAPSPERREGSSSRRRSTARA